MPPLPELGKRVKAKYPGQYDDLDDMEVGRRVKAKFPGDYDDFVDAPAPAQAPQPLFVGSTERAWRGPAQASPPPAQAPPPPPPPMNLQPQPGPVPATFSTGEKFQGTGMPPMDQPKPVMPKPPPTKPNGAPLVVSRPGPQITVLPPAEEQSFQQWAQQNSIKPSADYDLRGFYRAQKQRDPRAKLGKDGSFPDEWKTPQNLTFNQRSIYAGPDAPRKVGDTLVSARGEVMAGAPIPGTEKTGLPGVMPPIAPGLGGRQEEEQPSPGIADYGAMARDAMLTNAVASVGGKTATDLYDAVAGGVGDLAAKAIGTPKSKLASDFPAIPFVNEMVRTVPELVDTMLTPAGAVASAVGMNPALRRVAGPVVGAAFGTDMAMQVPEAIEVARQDPTPENLARATKAVGFAALPAAHGLTGLRAKAAERARRAAEPVPEEAAPPAVERVQAQVVPPVAEAAPVIDPPRAPMVVEAPRAPEVAPPVRPTAQQQSIATELAGRPYEELSIEEAMVVDDLAKQGPPMAEARPLPIIEQKAQPIANPEPVPAVEAQPLPEPLPVIEERTQPLPVAEAKPLPEMAKTPEPTPVIEERAPLVASPSFDATKGTILEKAATTDAAKAELSRLVEDFAVRNPDRQVVSFEDIKREAAELDPRLALSLNLKKGQTMDPALRFAAREYLNTVTDEIATKRAEIDAMPVGDKAAILEAEKAVATLEETAKGLADVLIPARSQDGRNLVYHRMMAEKSFDTEYWLSRAKKSKGLTPEASLPPDVQAGITEVLAKGREAERQAEKRVREKRPKPVTVPPERLAALTNAANEARARIKAAMSGAQLNANPVGLVADYAIIGAEKLAKGTLEFADWSKAMIEEFGETVQPMLQDIYAQARESVSEFLPKEDKPLPSRNAFVERKRKEIITRLKSALLDPKQSADPVSVEEYAAFEKDPQIAELRELVALKRDRTKVADVNEPTRTEMVSSRLDAIKARLRSSLKGPKQGPDPITPEEYAAFDKNPEVKALRDQLAERRKQVSPKEVVDPTREELVEKKKAALKSRLKAALKDPVQSADPVRPEEYLEFEKDPEISQLRQALAIKRAPEKSRQVLVEEAKKRLTSRLESSLKGDKATVDPVSPEERLAFESDPRIIELREQIAASRKPVTSEQRVERGVDRTVSRLQDQIDGKDRTPGEWALTPEEKALVQKDPAVQAARMELAKRMAKLDKSGILETLSTVRRAGLLTGPRTMLRNIGGNVTMTAMEELSRVPASMIDIGLSLFTGERTTGGASPMAVAKSSYEAATRGVQEAREIMKNGATNEQLAQFDLPRELNSGSQVLDVYTNTVYRFQSAQDRIFKRYAIERSLQEQMRLQGVEKPSESMMAQAIADADFATFNNENTLATGFRRFRGALPESGKFAADMFAPFVRTPANLLSRVVDYSGGGVARFGAQAIRSTINKALTAEEQRYMSQSLGRGVTGPVLIYLGWKLAESGMMTGARQDEPSARNTDEAAGRVPGGILVGGKWRQVSPMSPGGALLTIGATLQRESSEKIKDEAKRPEKVLAAGVRTVMDHPMLQGAQSLIEATNEPATWGKSLAASTAASFVPTGIADIAAAADTTRRDARDGDMLDSIGKSVASRLPGLRNTLPERVDVLGEPMPQASVLDPMNSTEAKELTDPVIKKLIDDEVRIGSLRKMPGEPDEAYRLRVIVGGRMVKRALTAGGDPEKAIQRVRGALTLRLKRQGYEAADAAKKIEILNRIEQ